MPFPLKAGPLARAHVKKADFVLVVCTQNYLHRFELEEAFDIGRGVKSEGLIITNQIYFDNSLNTKVVAVVLDPSDLQFVPAILRGSYCELHTELGLGNLYRHFRRLPGAPIPPIGPLPEPLAPLERNRSARYDTVDEFGEIYGGLLPGQGDRSAMISIDQLGSLAAMLDKFAIMADPVSRARTAAKFPPKLHAAVVVGADGTFDSARLIAEALSGGCLEALFEALLSAGAGRVEVKQVRERIERLQNSREAVALLHLLDISEDELYRLYCKAASGGTSASFGDGLDLWLESLTDMAPRSIHGPSRLGELMERVYERCPNRALDAWLTRSLKNQRGDIRARLRAEKASAATGVPYLAVMLNTSGLQPGEVPSLEYWLWAGSGLEVIRAPVPCPSGDVRDAFFRVLKEAS